MRPTLDFETYSEAGFVWDEQRHKWTGPPGAPQGKNGLSVVGAAVYARHPSTEVLSLSYNLGAGPRRWVPGMLPPVDLFAHLRSGGVLEAWNSGFEWWIWNHVCVRYGWPQLPQHQLRCAMAKSRAHGLPGKLELVSDVLDLPNKKDRDGTRLLAKFSRPRNPTKSDPRRRIRPSEDPVDGPRLYAYNDRDIVAEAEASARTPDLGPGELLHWLNDQTINRRGVQVDVEGIHACVAIVEQCVAKYDAELVALAGCKSTELQQLKGWLHAQGVHTDSLDEDSIDSLLAAPLPPQARRALELRQAVGSASVKKVFAMRNQMTGDGRLHDLYNFHGARTGRPTGEGPQPTNLPKAGPMVFRCGWHNGKPTALGGCGRHHGGHRYACPWCGRVRGPDKPAEWNPEAAEDALEVIGWRSLQLLEHFFGDAMLTVAGCLRGLFVARRGYRLISSDFTAIEGVVIAALAGEQWRLDVFRGDGRIYEVSASRAFGVPLDEFTRYRAEHNGQHHPLRQKGKIAELGLGFGGWLGAWKAFGGPGTDEEIKATILAWRDASPALVHFWGGQPNWRNGGQYFGLEGMAVLAVLNPGAEYPVHRLDGSYTGVSYVVRDDVLYCRLPSGRSIVYHRPRLKLADQEWRGWSLSYEGYNTNPKQGPIGWNTMSLYSGKCAENVTQAVARDIQMHAINNCERNDYPVVMHTYDEIVAEVPEGVGSVEGLEAHMTNVPAWARDWPIKAAGGWAARRYRKG